MTPGGPSSYTVPVHWVLTCTAGTGKRCEGQIDIDPPKGFKLTRVRTFKHGTPGGIGHLAKNPNAPVTCESECSENGPSATNGSLTFGLLTQKGGDELAGGKLEVVLTTTCNGIKHKTVFTLQLDADGFIDKKNSDLKGKPA